MATSGPCSPAEALSLFTFHTVVQMSPEELQGWKEPEFLNDSWGGEPPILQEHPFYDFISFVAVSYCTLGVYLLQEPAFPWLFHP